MKKHLLLGILLLFIIPKTYSQKTTITGKITTKTNESLPGVSIKIKGSPLGTVSDIDGNFSINAELNEILVLSYLGFQSKEVTILNNSLSITLQQDEAALDEVVVVGYGTQKKINLTGSVAAIDMEKSIKRPVSNVKNLLIGQIPGLITNQNPGLPGTDDVSLSIRGFGNPLVIVDGIESRFDRLDPNDIESVSVLKDASAAIYGARAGNGVILVTTKKGVRGKTQVSYHGWIGTQQIIGFPEMANATEFIQAGRNAMFNTQYDPTNPSQAVDYGTLFTEENLNLYSSGQLPSYDWTKGLLNRNGSPIQSHNLSFSGGSEKVRHYTSLGFFKQTGFFKENYNYNKFTITNNITIDLTKNLTMALTSSYIDHEQDYAAASVSQIFNDLRTSQPIYNYSLPDPTKAAYSGFSERSPVARSNKDFIGYDLTESSTLAAAIDIKYSLPFLKGLSIGAKSNVRKVNSYSEILKKPYTVWTYDPSLVSEDNDGYVAGAAVASNSFSKIYSSGSNPKTRLLSRLYSEYNKTFGKHTIGVLVFGEKEDNQYNNISITRRELLAPEIPQISGSDELTSVSGSGKPIEYTRVSFAGRLNYRFLEKYLFEFTLRSDASSKFGPLVRWGYFPSASVGWNIAEEAFLKSSKINQLKLRLSYSETGIDSNVGNTTFDYLTGFSESTGYIYSLGGEQVPIIYNEGLVNQLLTWEETTMYNAGIDYGLFNSKIHGAFDVFYRKRTGLLRYPLEGLPSTFGANLPLTNLDSRSNKGFDFSLGYRGKVGKVAFDVLGIIGHSKEKYINYLENIDETDPVQVMFNKRSGRDVNIAFGYKTDGIFNSQAEVDNYLETYTIEDLNGTPKAGDLKYVDLNGDGKINNEDREQIGYGSNPMLTYSLNTFFDYNGFSLNMLWQGGTRFNTYISGLLRSPFGNEQVPLKLHTQYSWVQDPNNPGVSSNPDYQLPAYERSGSRVWNDQFSDFWFKDATYVRLKSATLSYKLPQTTLQKLSLSNCEIYLSSDNLLTFSRLGIFKDAVDPEASYTINAYQLPLNRTSSLGIKIGI